MKKICVVTGSRAEYGLLKKLISRLDKEKSLLMQIIVTGAHLSEFYGNTYKNIIDDGFKIDKKIYIPIKKNNSKYDTTKFTGNAIIGFVDAYKKLDPDIIVVLGDRYEIFAATFSAMNMNIPVAHIHGGEKTLGSNDENMRHSITKMSKWHFVSTKEYKKRVIQLGEIPKNVHLVGALAYEAIKSEILYSKKLFEKETNLKLRKNNFLITFHPETSSNNFEMNTFENMINAVKKVKNSTIIFTLSNADAQGGEINKKIIEFVKKNKAHSIFFYSMGQKLYYSALKHCNIVLGNSSSGIIEAPYFFTPSINIGDRQTGRVSAKSVLNSKKDQLSITKAINKAIKLNSKSDRSVYYNPYGKLNSSRKILDILKTVELNNNNTKKLFFDIN